MAIKIKLGALLGPIVDATESRALAEQARAYVGEGFESLWTAHAVGRGFMLTDPFIAMTVAASVTEGVEIGSAIIQIPLYHPLDLAHRVHSLQQICGDRLILGVGAGSTDSDFKAYDRDPKGRFNVFNDTVAALRQGYAEDTDANKALSPWPGLTSPRDFSLAPGARALSGPQRNSTVGSPRAITARSRS